MGVGSSNPYEPVHFDPKSEDVRFRNVRPEVPVSSPLDIRSRGNDGDALSSRPARQTHGVSSEKRPKSLGVEESCSRGGPRRASESLGDLGTPLEADEAWDTGSLRGNFSVGSLAERSRRTERLLAAFSASHDDEDDDFSTDHPPSDSVLFRRRGVCSSRRMSLESEFSDTSLFDACRVESSCEAFAAMDRLESILLDTKRELLNLDAELVGLRAPRNSGLLPSAFPSDDDDSGKGIFQRRNSLVDIVDQHKMFVKSCGLLEKRRDSGSDFGNSLESDDDDHPPEDSLSASLEWDSADGISEITPEEVYVPGALREEIRRAIVNSDRRRRITRSRTLPADWLSKRNEAAAEGPSDSNGNPLLVWSDARDSGYGDSEPPVGERMTVASFVAEAFGESPRGDRDREYLLSVLRDRNVETARRIRRDNYSAIRAATFGVVARGRSALARHGGAREVYQRLSDLLSSEMGSWLTKWQFCPSLGYNENVSWSEGFWDCLSFLQAVEEQINEPGNDAEDRESVLAAVFNRDPALDARIVEAVRILLLRSVFDLYENPTSETTLSTDLFSRETSRNPQEFLVDRLDTFGTDKVELQLLGYALKTTLIVVSLGRAERKDLVRRYQTRESCPEVVLGEHDGGYCVFGR